MPKPPMLPKLDWPDIWESAKPYAEWLAQAEFAENAEKIEAIRASLTVEAHREALLKSLPCRVHVVAIAEDWCGDVVRHVPVLQKLSDLSNNLEVRYISRDDQPDVFIRFLTNGGEAIPKFVFLSDAFVECGNWGPMPDACKKIIARGKACGDVPSARKKVSAYYQADENYREVVDELLELVDLACSSA